jgi:hypothetical protein
MTLLACVAPLICAESSSARRVGRENANLYSVGAWVMTVIDTGIMRTSAER